MVSSYVNLKEKKNVSDHRFPPEVWDQKQTPVVFLMICICFKTLLGLASAINLEFG